MLAKPYLFVLSESTILLALFSIPSAYASTNPVDLNVDVKMSDIGFITIGDEVPVTVTVINNTNETRFFVISAILRPDRIQAGGFQGDENRDSRWIKAHSPELFNFTYTARYPELWRLIVVANGYNST